MRRTLASCFPLAGRWANLPADVVERFKHFESRAGFVPNVALLLANRPAEFRGFFALHDALLSQSSSELSAAEKEMIVVVTSALNRCCIVSRPTERF